MKNILFYFSLFVLFYFCFSKALKIKSTASEGLFKLSATGSGISTLNSSSMAMITSTTSKLSKPKSEIN